MYILHKINLHAATNIYDGQSYMDNLCLNINDQGLTSSLIWATKETCIEYLVSTLLWASSECSPVSSKQGVELWDETVNKFSK